MSIAEPTAPAPKHPENESPSGQSANSHWWVDIIESVKTPLGFLTLVVLVISSVFVVYGANARDPVIGRVLVIGALALMFLTVGIVGYKWIQEPPGQPIHPIVPPGMEVPHIPAPEPSSSLRPESTGEDATIVERVEKEGRDVLYANEGRSSSLGVWYRELRPYLHQAAHYSIPMYYLDTKLHIIDWNLAFDVVFPELVGLIRGKHVNWFIARMANFNAVFDHAREFTKNVIENNAFPYVDKESIIYASPDLGTVETIKIAAQLTDTHGKGRGWAVALVPKQIDWAKFETRLMQRIENDKIWSVYSASYDRILLKFPPYLQLVNDVTAVVPKGDNLSVLDLGCGTGNVTRVLLEKGYRVTAIEDNLGMLDRFAAKLSTAGFDADRIDLVKSSIEHLDFLPDNFYDAAVMVNVLYALDRETDCLRAIHRVLKVGGVLGLSTTHRETKLDPLLKAIKDELTRADKFDRLAADYDSVYRVNKHLESTLVKRRTRDDVRQMVQMAGFQIIQDTPSTYEGAVMLLHARKVSEPDSTPSK